jgi:signal transduction histidine kinase
VTSQRGTSPHHLLTIASRCLFDDLADRGIVVTDPALVVRGWNPWLVRQSGIPAEDAVGQPLFTVVPAIAARGLAVHYRRALEGEVRVLAHRFHQYLIPVGRGAATAAVNAGRQTAQIVPLYARGRVAGTMTIVEDVSDRVINERELRTQIRLSERARAVAEDASTLKDEFLSTMSHEIRTPLNAVLGWTQILRTRGVQSADHALDVIERNASSELRLVEDLLDMARIISGKLRLDVRTIDVRTIVQAEVDAIEAGAAAKRVAITVRFDDVEMPVNADSDRLQQAIWNVIFNGLKFTGSGGSIDVSVSRKGATIDIAVADTGQGISAEFLPYVFDRFRQADSSPSRRYGGLGLGLALTRQIVELHGGSVDVRSPGADKGSTFTIRLPIAYAVHRTAPKSAAAG